MADRAQPHRVWCLRGQRGTPAASAEKQKAFVLGKDRLVVGTFGIDPEFEHAARTMKRAGHAPFTLELANVANIDKGHVLAAMKGKRLFDRQVFDLALGGVDQRAKPGRNFLRHENVHPDRWSQQHYIKVV